MIYCWYSIDKHAQMLVGARGDNGDMQLLFQSCVVFRVLIKYILLVFVCFCLSLRKYCEIIYNYYVVVCFFIELSFDDVKHCQEKVL